MGPEFDRPTPAVEAALQCLVVSNRRPPLESDTCVSRRAGHYLTRGSVRHRRALPLAMTLLLASSLWAQPGNIASIPQPVSGPEIFDAAGSLYSFGSGPVTPGAAQTQSGGGTCLIGSGGFFEIPVPCPDAYVAKVDPSGNLVWGTHLGGPTGDQAAALAVDGAGNAFVTGGTGGSFPTTANAAIAVSTTARAFAAKISADGSRVLYSTYLPDTVAGTSAIAIDPHGNAYIAGLSSTHHAIVVKLSADGSAFLYNVSLAGSHWDYAAAILAGGACSVMVAGQTTSPDFPVSPGALQQIGRASCRERV